MVDLISKAAAIEAVRRLVIAGWGTDHGVMDSDVIYEALEELPSAQRWIPVTERLPEKHGEQYIVTISDGSIYSSALQFDATKKRWYLSFLNEGEIFIDIIDDVTAWMPLPEPFREGGAE